MCRVDHCGRRLLCTFRHYWTLRHFLLVYTLILSPTHTSIIWRELYWDACFSHKIRITLHFFFRSPKSPAALSLHVNLSPEEHLTDCCTTCRMSPVLQSLPHTEKNSFINSKMTDHGTILVVNLSHFYPHCVYTCQSACLTTFCEYKAIYFTHNKKKKKGNMTQWIFNKRVAVKLYFNTKCGQLDSVCLSAEACSPLDMVICISFAVGHKMNLQK
jgi:hypothetical protein